MKIRNLTIFILVLITGYSCIPRKKLQYTRDQKPKELQNEYVNIRPEKSIQPFDNIYIKVSSIDEQTARVFDTRTGGGGTENINLISYTINEHGYINFPFVGEIYVKDMTLTEAQVRIEEEVSQYLPNISISVKFVNNKVSIIGEVRRAGSHVFYRDQITIFQALSLAGGTTEYGKLTNVILIREANNKVNYYYLDLTDKEIVASDFYYMIPNDVLIVRAIRAKYRNLSLINVPLFLTTITTAVTLYFLFRNTN